MTEPKEGLRILARIIARAYLVDSQGTNATIARTQRRIKKDESVPRTMRSDSDGEGSH